MYEFTLRDKKNPTVQDIKNAIDCPEVKTDLPEEEKIFLKRYAKNRVAYTERSFTDEEARIVRRILDRIFYQFVMLHEHADFQLTSQANNLMQYRDSHREEMKAIQKLGENLSEQNGSDWTRRNRD